VKGSAARRDIRHLFAAPHHEIAWVLAVGDGVADEGQPVEHQGRLRLFAWEELADDVGEDDEGQRTDGVDGGQRDRNGSRVRQSVVEHVEKVQRVERSHGGCSSWVLSGGGRIARCGGRRQDEEDRRRWQAQETKIFNNYAFYLAMYVHCVCK